MRALVACEYSARIRDAFIKKGHNAMSCDLLPSESDLGEHYQGDMFDLDFNQFDLIIAHPPCTYLTVSGLHWNKRNPERALKTEEALKFIERIWSIDCEKLAIENPVGCINSKLPFMPKPQYIQPYDFGEDASKKTGFWTRGCPPLKPTKRHNGGIVNQTSKKVEGWRTQTDSGQNALPPSKDRWKLRSYTYQGIADAIADQWSN